MLHQDLGETGAAAKMAASDSARCSGRKPRYARRPGPLSASGHQVLSEQVHNPLGQALLAQHDVQLAAGGNAHKYRVEKAVRMGKRVPPAVISDYPDLASRYFQPVDGGSSEPSPPEYQDG